MFKSSVTKIFFAFALVIFLMTSVFVWLFSSIFSEESEAYYLESALQQVKDRTFIVEKSVGSKASFKLALEEQGLAALSDSFEERLDKMPVSADWIRRNRPESGSKVTRCQGTSSNDLICAYWYSDPLRVWAFDWMKPPPLIVVVKKLLGQIWAPILLLLLFSLGLAMLLSKGALSSLQRFAGAAERVAKGDYENIELPTERRDEVGKFAQAFERMITDLRQRERRLAETGVRLAHSERLATVGQMGAGIAHEVKNPLMSMIGYGKVLKNKVQDPELKEASEIIVKEGERCTNILSQILRFSRNDPNESKPYPINDVIESSWILLKAEAKRRNVHLEKEDGPASIVKGSPQQVQQVIMNLVINALHASEPNQKVLIRTLEKDDKLILEVKDQGRGIPQELQDRIFDPFFTTKEEGEGTGLGLSVAAEIVQNQGGELSFESAAGEGTTFRLKLPLAAG